MKVAVIGKIGAGKSMLVRLLAERLHSSWVQIDCDAWVHHLYANNEPKLVNALRSHPDWYDPELGKLDKQRIATAFVKDVDACRPSPGLQALSNALDQMLRDKIFSSGENVIVELTAPSWGLQNIFDMVIEVTCAESIRYKRAVEREVAKHGVERKYALDYLIKVSFFQNKHYSYPSNGVEFDTTMTMTVPNCRSVAWLDKRAGQIAEMLNNA